MHIVSQQNEHFFNEAFELHFERVVAYINAYCRDKEMARNIAQDTYVTFWENIDKVDSTKTALPYLFFVAKNKTLNALKRDLVKERYSNYTQKRDLEITCRALDSSTIDKIHVQEIEKLVSKSVEQMNDKVKETFCLSRFNNLKNEEVAKKLDVSVKTVEYRMAAALRILRKNLKDFIKVLLFFIGV
ncbi:MAG: sigma-70 family RNA polymerase sigma factor [Bacteroidales bacterium]